MKQDTIVVTPDIYKHIQKPNTIDFNNAFATHTELVAGESPRYKRECRPDNTLVLAEVIRHLYGINSDNNITLCNSGLAVVTLIVFSKWFKRIFYKNSTFPDIVNIYNTFNNAYEFSSINDLNDLQAGDLVAIETFGMPNCEDNRKLIKEVSDKAHKVGARVLVDNACCTAYVCNPFNYGADIVMESLSKLSNGFNTSLIGALLVKNDDKEMYDFIKKVRKLNGYYSYYPHPLDSWLTVLGLQTLTLRLKKIKETTRIICQYLLENDVKFDAMYDSGIIFITPGNNFDKGLLYLLIRVFQVANTFGTNFSVICYWDDYNRIRLSIGLENATDLIEALDEVIKYLK